MIRVSPFHEIRLADELVPMLSEPPPHDYVVRRIATKEVNGQPLIQGELVISGLETLTHFPLAGDYPVHFRKTYYPICFHQDPAKEFENHLAASEVIDVPPPIGSTRTTFRSCFLPGIAFDRLAGFGVEPEVRNIQIAEGMAPAAAIGLWQMLEGVYGKVVALHAHGFAHGDLFLHNVIVSLMPVGVHLIDFEQAVRRGEDMDEARWREVVAADLREIFKQAIYLQCALGRQRGELGDAAMDALGELFDSEGVFRRAIERRGGRI